MIVDVVDQDILKIKEGVICHQVNCMGAAGGLAGAIFRKYPTAHSQYKITVQSFLNDWLPLGTTDLIEVESNLFVANMFAQYEYGTDSRKTEYGTFRMCIRDLISNIHWQKNPINKIYFPYGIGCGLGGGNWEIIREVIKYEFTDYKYKIIICKKD